MAESKETVSNDSGVSRRNLFHILGAVSAGTALAHANENHEGMTHGAAEAPSHAGPYVKQTFDAKQWKTVGVLCDLIIPADERSGSATAAGVPEFMDDWIAFRAQQDGNNDLQAEIFGGLAWLDREAIALDAADFASASVQVQKKILDRVAWPAKAAPEDARWVRFFNNYRDLTVGGFFSSKMGVKDLPYLGNVAVAEWKGCDPKVWAVIEDRMKNGYTSDLVKGPVKS